jgi:SAM-dependent methyltransferase
LAVIKATIIPAVEDSATLVGFYERAYSLDGSRAAEYARWRALSAVGKAEHVIALCDEGKIEPASTLDVGCGDGALLRELSRAGFGGELGGMEISEPAAEIARRDGPGASIGLFDGERLPLDEDSYELGVLSHVLEHVPDPTALLAEVARVCGAVIFEVPLEANVSALRRAKREHAVEIGHLQRLGRSSARRIARGAGLRVAAELQDPLPLEVHRFFAGSGRARKLASAKWLTRASLSRVAPPLARRLFTVHYACLCVAPER